MQITTRNDGSNILVEVDGLQVAAFDIIESSIRDARMRAEAFIEGYQRCLAVMGTKPAPDGQPQMRLYSWESDAVSDRGQPGIVAAFAENEHEARKKIRSLAGCGRGVRVGEFSITALMRDLAHSPTVHRDEAMVVYR